MPRKFNISQFASDQLLKSGWVQGKGLGRNEDGISEPVKAKIKTDKTGVGLDPGEKFTYHWWDHAFRNSAKNIKVSLRYSLVNSAKNIVNNDQRVQNNYYIDSISSI